MRTRGPSTDDAVEQILRGQHDREIHAARALLGALVTSRLPVDRT
ncbi:MAG: hypothetical protein U0414_23885 [Polyangiaceae bacterium]